MRSKTNVNVPHFTSAEILADNFSIFFMMKTTIIRNKIIPKSANTTFNSFMDAYIMFNGNMFEIFRPASEVQLKEINKQVSEKMIWLGFTAYLAFKEMCGSTATTDNRSLKQASITPLLKRIIVLFLTFLSYPNLLKR